MRARTHRRGFTLVEMMVSVAVLGIVLTAVGSSFITTQRMLKDAMGLCELSLAAREIREKILFSASPSGDGVRYAGLLSASAYGSSGAPVSDGGNSITMEACTMGTTLAGRSTSPSQIEIELETASDGTRRYLYNNKITSEGAGARWLRPLGTSIMSDNMSDILTFDTPTAVGSSSYGSSQNAVRLNLDIVLTSDAKNPDGTPMVRRERVVVPIFGVIQPFRVDGKY